MIRTAIRRLLGHSEVERPAQRVQRLQGTLAGQRLLEQVEQEVAQEITAARRRAVGALNQLRADRELLGKRRSARLQDLDEQLSRAREEVADLERRHREAQLTLGGRDHELEVAMGRAERELLETVPDVIARAISGLRGEIERVTRQADTEPRFDRVTRKSAAAPGMTFAPAAAARMREALQRLEDARFEVVTDEAAQELVDQVVAALEDDLERLRGGETAEVSA